VSTSGEAHIARWPRIGRTSIRYVLTAKSAMKKPAKDRIREERIRNEVIVDAYGPQEQGMGWYYYLEGKMLFPFQAPCTVT
jgi:hypothetical protein